MKKDVIYIDIEDDVTAVIEKLKNSNEKIVAFVPPKGSSVLQSTVNLKLLKRAAKTSSKQLVLVTNSNALLALAGGLEIYVAKNLQSKPYIPSDEVTEADDTTLDLSETVPAAAATAAVVGASVALNDNDELEVDGEEIAADLEKDGDLPKNEKAKPEKTSKKSGKKVPNFNSFKKKLLIFGGGGLALIILLLFFVVRPKAEIVIRAETTPVDIAYEATVSDSGTSEPDKFIFRAQVQKSDKSVTQSFTPTGKKDVGKTATGTVILSTNQISALGTVIPAGTSLTSTGGKTFLTDSSVTITLTNSSNAPVGVTASAKGAGSNGQSGSLSGAPSSIAATFDGSSAGGTDKTVTVVTQADINKAKAELAKKDNSAVKTELQKAFGDDVKVLTDSFEATVGKTTSEPAVGQEANEGKLTAQVAYTLLAITNEDLKVANETAITKEMDNKDQQQVYKDGVDDSQFEKVKLNGTNGIYKITALGQFGPKFDTSTVAEEVAGKKVGEVRSYIQDLPGVKSTDIKISPFWSSKTPSADKIEIKLEVDENSAS
jgi:hypothetical protein